MKWYSKYNVPLTNIPQILQMYVMNVLFSFAFLTDFLCNIAVSIILCFIILFHCVNSCLINKH